MYFYLMLYIENDVMQCVLLFNVWCNPTAPDQLKYPSTDPSYVPNVYILTDFKTDAISDY